MPPRQGFLVALILLPTLGFGQSQFAGKWQTKTSTVTGKHSITVNIAVTDGKVGGTVVLVDPDGSEIEMRAVNPRLNEDALQFETALRDDTFYWRLRLRSKTKAFLHGSMHEMLIDERVTKRR